VISVTVEKKKFQIQINLGFCEGKQNRKLIRSETESKSIHINIVRDYIIPHIAPLISFANKQKLASAVDRDRELFLPVNQTL
jgi:hypothetical protein